MTTCYDEGTLRAALDAELGPLEQTLLAEHLRGCPRCRAAHAALRTHATLAAQLLAAPPPDLAARARLSAAIAAERAQQRQAPVLSANHGPLLRPGAEFALRPDQSSRSNPMQTITRTRRWLAPLAMLALAAALFALPPVRAAADQLLNLFRVQNVVFLPINPERAQQLRDLKIDPATLLTGVSDGQKPEPQSAADAAAAAQAAGFAPAAVNTFPAAPASTTYQTLAAATREGTVQVAQVRQLLAALQITDVSVPDALGVAPVKVASEPLVLTRYTGAGYELTLAQGAAPSVTLPPGVDAALPNRILLRVLGMDPAQAETLARQVDLRSTLILPFPQNVRDVRTVTVNGAPGLLVMGRGPEGRGGQITWQRDGRFYALGGQGLDDAALIAAAESVR